MLFGLFLLYYYRYKEHGYFVGKEVCGKLSLKHIYEIAKIKSEDPTFDTIPLQEVCRNLIGQAHRSVVNDIDIFSHFVC